LAEVQVQNLVDRHVENTDGPQQVPDGAIAMAGLPLRLEDLFVDFQRPAARLNTLSTSSKA
jgi:hypothetical protein